MLNDKPPCVEYISQSLEYMSNITEHAITWARQAGKMAMRYFKNVSVEYKSDDTLLTQADVEIEQFLVAQISSTYPDHALLGEEGARNEINSPYMWVIDPLDGTTTFVQGLPGWGIALGLLYLGQPIFGLFYMPLLDDLTYTTHDGIYCNQQILRQTVRTDWSRKGFLAVTSTAHRDFDIDLFRTRALGSVSANLVYTARGSATAALIPKAYLWDLVAAACILKQAGGAICYLSGKPVDYSALTDGSLAPEAIIAGHPDLLAQLQRAIRPREARLIKPSHDSNQTKRPL